MYLCNEGSSSAAALLGFLFILARGHTTTNIAVTITVNTADYYTKNKGSHGTAIIQKSEHEYGFVLDSHKTPGRMSVHVARSRVHGHNVMVAEVVS